MIIHRDEDPQTDPETHQCIEIEEDITLPRRPRLPFRSAFSVNTIGK
jgi:hypothetical protein